MPFGSKPRAWILAVLILADPAETVADILLDPFDNFSALQNFKEKA